MRLVVDELKAAGFVHQTDLDAKMAATLPPDFADQLSGLSRRLGSIERELKDPDGTLAKLEGRIKSLEDRRAGEAIERGGKTFRDLSAVSAWVQTFKEKHLYRYCVDMVTLVMLCSEAYETIAEGMVNAASAFKADYNSLTEARIAFSYGMTYPENLLKKQDKQKHVATGGWFWTPAWSSYSAFKGTFNNGAKDNISRVQATAWIDAIEPLYEILTAAGMTTDDAWERVLIFCKAVFDDIRTVRAITLDTKNTAGMIWGSFRTTKLLEEYRRLKFYQHPHVSNMLALTSLQREGKKVETALSTLGTITKDVEKVKSQCAQHEKDIKALKSAK
jgi:archaellum component FlaC